MSARDLQISCEQGVLTIEDARKATEE